MQNNLTGSFKPFLQKVIIAIIILLISLLLTNQNYNQLESTPNYQKDLLKIRSLSIFVNAKDYKFLFSDKPLSLKSQQQAFVIADKIPQALKAKFRVHGGHNWHWDIKKPSFRLKFKGSDRYLGRKIIDCINPDDASGLSNILSSYLAKTINLAHIETTLCKVTINNDYRGLYQLTDCITPATLFRQGFGNIPIAVGNSWQLNMWRNSDLWDIKARNDSDITLVKANVKRLLGIIHMPFDFSRINKLSEIVDLQKLALWSAFTNLTVSLHADDFHNNVLAFDDNKKLFFPVLSDPTGFGVLTSIASKNRKEDIEIPIYEFMTPLIGAAFRNPKFQFKRNKVMYDLLNTKLSIIKVNKLVTDLIKILTPLFKNEKYAGALTNIPFLGFSIRLPVSYKQQIDDGKRLLDYYSKRLDFIKSCLNKCEVSIEPFNKDASYKGTPCKAFVVKVSGHAPIDFNLTGFENKLIIDSNLNKLIDANDNHASATFRLFPALTKIAYNDTEWLMTKTRLQKYILAPSIQTYLIGIRKGYTDRVLNLLASNAMNSITGRKVVITLSDCDIDQSKLYNQQDSIHPWSQ